jgi:pantothenate kinase
LTFSDLVVENIDDCIEWIKEFSKNPQSKKIKDITIIDKAINSYLDEK